MQDSQKKSKAESKHATANFIVDLTQIYPTNKAMEKNVGASNKKNKKIEYLNKTKETHPYKN